MATLEIDGSEPGFWFGGDLGEEDGIYTLPALVLAELETVAAYVRDNPLPALALQAEDFELTQSVKFAASLRDELRNGLGFVILDRLPLDRWSREQAIAVYYLFSGLIERPVAQSWDGKLIYEVRDKGKPPGNGIRPDITNAEQNFHNDNSYNNVPPHVVGLFCLQTAKSGGISGVISFKRAWAEMRRRHPDLAERLNEPYYFDRQREHAPGDVMVTHHPMITIDGDTFCARLSRRQIINGHKMAEVELDNRSAAALEAFEDILNEPGAAKNFMFERGQIQYLNNLTLGHRRTGFEDWDEPEKKRELIRLWLRDSGRRGYNG